MSQKETESSSLAYLSITTNLGELILWSILNTFCNLLTIISLFHTHLLTLSQISSKNYHFHTFSALWQSGIKVKVMQSVWVEKKTMKIISFVLDLTWSKHTCHMSRRDRKILEFWSLKTLPGGTPFFRKICFVPESLWPVKCTAFSDFWTGQRAIKTIITRSGNRESYIPYLPDTCTAMWWSV